MKYTREIEEIIKNYIFLDDKNKISLIADVIKKDDAFCQQFEERKQEEKENMVAIIAKKLLKLYRKSLKAIQNPKTDIDWSVEYKKVLALYGDEGTAREIVVDRIMKEIGVDIIRAGKILDRAINNNERQ